VLQDFHPLDGAERNRRKRDALDALDFAGEALDPVSVDQDKRAAAAKAAQRRRLRRKRRRAHRTCDGHRTKAVVRRDLLQQLHRRRGAGLVDLLARDDGDRQCAFAFDSLDVRTRHLDANVGTGLGSCERWHVRVDGLRERTRSGRRAADADDAGERGRDLLALEKHVETPKGKWYWKGTRISPFGTRSNVTTAIFPAAIILLRSLPSSGSFVAISSNAHSSRPRGR